jgi:hypothetical protein
LTQLAKSAMGSTTGSSKITLRILLVYF